MGTLAERFDLWLDRTSFPVLAWNDRDRRRIEFVRIAVGALMIWRFVIILDSTRFYFRPPTGWLGLGGSESRFALFELALALCVLVGFLTPICLVALVLTCHRFDTVMLTRILGTSVLIHTLVILLLSGAGSALSVDSLLARRSGMGAMFGAPIRFLYRRLGDPTSAAVRSYLFFGLIAYWVLSLGAVLNHASDEYWRSGDTIRVTLQNSYISRVSGLARAMESAHPQILAAFSQFCNVGQGTFQLAMGLLIRWRWGCRFVIWWGVGFFVFSLVFLQLSFLPHLELCLWVLVFARSKPDAPASTDSKESRMGTAGVESKLRARTRSTAATGALICTFSILCMVAVLSFPQMKRGVDSVLGLDVNTAFQHAEPRLDGFLAAAGMNPPNVFNAADLRMGDAWPVIYRIGVGGSLTEVPFSAGDGSRLWYHVSDVIYVGNSLRWRRAMIGADIAAQHQPTMSGFISIERILLYDYRRRGGSDPVTYRVDLFTSKTSRLEVPVDERFDATRVYSYTETIDD